MEDMETSVIKNCDPQKDVLAEDTKSFIESSHPAKNPQIHRDEKKSSFVCNFCFKVFTRSVGLNQHIHSVHTNEKPFICDVCSKEFLRSDRLEQHLLTHKNNFSNERPKQLLIHTGVTEKSFFESCDLEKILLM